MAVELKPHQQKAVDELSNGKILWGDVGIGKSYTALAYFYSKVIKGVYGDMGSVREPRNIYIITTAKKRDDLDWEKDCAQFGIGKEPNGSIPGVLLTVDSWNNVAKYREVKDAFFIFDEQRVVGSGVWTKSFVEIAHNNQWILLSATPGDTWMDYVPVFLANGWYKNRTQFKREHVIYKPYQKFPKIDRYIGLAKLQKYKNHLLVEMPYERHTTRHHQDIPVTYDINAFERVTKKRWHVFEHRPLRDVAELFSVMRKVVNSDASRLEAIRELTQKHPRLIVFYNFDYELEALRTLVTAGPTEPSPSTTDSPPSSTSSTSSDSTPSNPNFPMKKLPTPMGVPEKAMAEARSLLTQPSPESGSKRSSASTSTTGSGTRFSTSPIEIAEWNGHKHQPVPTSDRWVYLVQYTAGSEGWNCTTTDAMCFYSLTYSYKQFHQAHGRIDRLNTPFQDLYYYVLWAGSPIEKMVRKALKMKRDFNYLEVVNKL